MQLVRGIVVHQQLTQAAISCGADHMHCSCHSGQFAPSSSIQLRASKARRIFLGEELCRKVSVDKLWVGDDIVQKRDIVGDACQQTHGHWSKMSSSGSL